MKFLIQRIGRIIMKKKLRRKLKDFYQIGNYIYSNSNGKIAVVIPKGERLTDIKIANDMNYLIKFYGVEYANYFINCCSEYLKK